MASPVPGLSRSRASPPEVLQNQPGGYDKLSNFEQGFVDAVLTRAKAEDRMAAGPRTNHDNHLRQSAERSMPR